MRFRDLAALHSLLLLTLAATAAPPAAAAARPDWPALYGPLGNGVSPEAGVLSPASVEALVEAWRTPLGSGYSSVVTAGDRAFTLFSDGDRDVAAALDTQSGEELWRTPLGETYRGHDGSHDGPIATPTVAGDRLVAATPHGRLSALDVASGAQVWSVDLAAEHGVEVAFYGYAHSPLVDGDRVIVQGLGAEAPALLAFDLADGRLLWKGAGSSPGESYASPLLTTLAGARQVVALGRNRLFAADPADGRLLWEKEVEAGHPERLMALPDDRLLVPGWDEGLLMFQVRREGEGFAVEERWREARVGSSHAPPIHLDGLLFAFDGSILVCLDASDGSILWRHRTYDGSVIGVDGYLAVLGRRSGLVHLLRPHREGYEELARFAAFEPGTQAITPLSTARGLILARSLQEVVALRSGEAPGSTRDGVAETTHSGAEIEELWRLRLDHNLAPSGTAAVVVGESLAYTLLSDGDSDFAVALDPTAAREIWRHRLDPTAEGADSGPGGSPVLSGDTLFALSTSCRLFALDAAGGRALWQIDLKDELAAGSRSRGCQSTPAVYQDTVIVSPAGETHRVVALDRATGRLVWSNGDVDPPRYASPVVAEILGEPQLLVHGYERSEEGSIHSTVYGLDPSSGTTLWRFSEASDWSFTTPSVMEDGSVLYSGWNRTIRISLTRSDDGVWEPRARWTSSSLESVVGRDGLIFAASGENLLCLRLDDGEQLWSRPIGRSFVTPYGGALAVLSSEAPYVRLVEASGEDYRELVRLEVFSPGAVNNTPPTVDGATLLVRNGEELVALRRRSAPAGPIR